MGQADLDNDLCGRLAGDERRRSAFVHNPSLENHAMHRSVQSRT